MLMDNLLGKVDTYFWLIENKRYIEVKGLISSNKCSKAFGSVDHSFLISTLERSVFGNRFINLVKILLKNQESCIMAAILLIILNFKKAQDKATQYLLTYLF